jgi:hypothetical protein
MLSTKLRYQDDLRAPQKRLAANFDRGELAFQE